MKLIKKLITRAGGYTEEYHGIHSLSVNMDSATVQVALGSWATSNNAKIRATPVYSDTITIYLATWNESSTETLFGLITTLPQFEGGIMIDTTELPEQTIVQASIGHIYDVGAAPL